MECSLILLCLGKLPLFGIFQTSLRALNFEVELWKFIRDFLNIPRFAIPVVLRYCQVAVEGVGEP
jgi:hypothetical protein